MTFDKRHYDEIVSMLAHYDPHKFPLDAAAAMGILMNDLDFMRREFDTLRQHTEALVEVCEYILDDFAPLESRDPTTDLHVAVDALRKDFPKEDKNHDARRTPVRVQRDKRGHLAERGRPGVDRRGCRLRCRGGGRALGG